MVQKYTDKIMLIKTLCGLVDKTRTWQHMELFKNVFKANERLLPKMVAFFCLFIIDWYVNTLIKFHYEFVKLPLADAFLSTF